MIPILLLTLVVSSRSKMDPFIVGGRETSVRHWPFIAFIEATLNGRSAAACGGSLISSQTVLTAAHCMDDTTDSKKLMYRYRFTIYMGSSIFAKSTMTRHVIDYTSNNKYDPYDETVKGDISVLFLSKPVTFASTVKKVLLMRSFDAKRDKNLEVAGWGMTNPLYSEVNKQLKSADLTALSSAICKNVADSSVKYLVCTAPSKHYAFSGDSGGPLIKKDSSYQIGVVSYREENTGVTIFSSVAAYYDWIQNTQLMLFKKYCPIRG